MDEKRRDERFDLSLNATLMVIGKKTADKDQIIHLSTKDICLGGAFFTTTKPLPLGTEVRIQMVLPLHMLKTLKEKKALLRVEKGIVLRHEADGMAIVFEKGCDIAHLKPITLH